MTRALAQKWLELSQKKATQLCVGIDPRGLYSNTGEKMEWIRGLMAQTCSYAAAFKINRNDIRDLSGAQVAELCQLGHRYQCLMIDDAKLADIAESNYTGMAHAKAQGFDAITFAPFAGNTLEAYHSAKELELGLFALLRMSNPEYSWLKGFVNASGLNPIKALAKDFAELPGIGIVIGAPSLRNGLKPEEIEELRELVGGAHPVLVPGIGAQGGDFALIRRSFGSLALANVGRDIASAPNPREAAEKWGLRLGLSI